MGDNASLTKTADRRRCNNPHLTVFATGVTAARKGLRVYDCPYQHPAMRASWLKGFAQAQQLSLDL
ncbi:CrpP family protein [Pseudomonas gessardii]|uniref:CrpP family protein n=1 Tax=Pseudomonas gessardii TaxID=78544 RepID=A0ABS9FF85_9PSED|nr:MULTISPECIES: CrpP family ICE-associated protein [Pseudomonadaceae]MCF4988749.1 CrpP family protein [Pseudomonas gessardii]MCF5098409.1 CrpP family protein [Pseudomonas gessardii]MCF5110997.1 CrpP family protein [Pseudomonas gessardii]MCF5510655.1 CrpP family protein [Pseudomonas sp. PA-3-6H]MCF5559787.1 CrpP family protein [Pseudomonas sp. PA-3-5D]